jgi:hypothetical protein
VTFIDLNVFAASYITRNYDFAAQEHTFEITLWEEDEVERFSYV